MTFKTVIAVLTVFAFLAPCPAMDRLSALSMLESGDNDRAIGAHGEQSRFQILPSVWRAATTLTTYSDPFISRGVANLILIRREDEFMKRFHRYPNDLEFYALWNAPAQAYRGRLSPAVLERAQRFENLCTSKH